MLKYCSECGERLDTWFSDGSGWGSVTQCANCGDCYMYVAGDWGAPATVNTISYSMFKETLLKAPKTCYHVNNPAFYFGTFNPIHIGHLYVAEQIEKLGYKVIFVPAYDSPWKEDAINNFDYRAAMIYGVTYNLSLIEKEIGRPSYSAQTIRNLLDEYKLDKINFIIGMDAFAQIDKWKSPEVLKKYCHFLVIPRDNINIDFDKMEKDGWDFEYVKIKPYELSSSIVREKINNGENIDKLIPSEVKKIIDVFNLYKEN